MTRRGFTLTELLVTISLIVVVGATATAALFGGLRVWERASVFGAEQQPMLAAFAQVSRELRSVRRFASIGCEGVYNQLTMPSVQPASPESSAAEIGQLGFFLEERTQRLCRGFVPYRLMRDERVTDHCRTVLEHVRQIRFEYFSWNEATRAGEWSSRWEAPHPPAAVKLTVTVQPDAQAAPAQQTFLVTIPLGWTPPPSAANSTSSEPVS